MRRLNIQWVGVGLTIVILATLVFVAVRSTAEVSRSAQERSTARARLQALDTFILQVNQAETGQRGFLLTGKKSYLEPFSRARENYVKVLERLRSLYRQDPENLGRVGILEALSRQKYDELASTIELRGSKGFERAIRVVNTDVGFDLMRRIEEVGNHMRAAEQSEVAAADERVKGAWSATTGAIYVGIPLELLVIVGVLFLARREAGRRQRAEMQLRALNSGLELKVIDATSELRRALADLEAKSALLGTVLEQMPAAVIVADATGKLVLGNSQMESIWRHPLHMSANVEQYAEWKGFHPDGRRYVGADWPLARALRSGELIKNEDTEVERGDGTRAILRLTAAPIREGDAIAGAVVICEDVTDLKRLERLEASERAAVEASRLKSEFLANMSHEIRTPMNAIIGMSELLAETPLDEEQARFVETSRRAADNLLGLLNDILDISKIEAGDLRIDRIPFDLRETVEASTELSAHRAHAKGIELAVQIRPDVPTALVGDPNRLRQILINLVGNAVKFTERGEIVVRIEREPGAASSTALRFSVSDTGIGIAPQQLDRLFDRFAQLDSSITRRYGGTGLGLNICKQLVGLMGGRIWAESAPGEGSRFSFTIELDHQTGQLFAPEAAEADFRGVRALIVDDNFTNRLILTETLRSWGARTEEADGGEAALALIRDSRRASDPFRFLLLDYRMPGMDGLETAAAVRRELGDAEIAMMVLTSDNRSGLSEQCRRLGMSDYLVKPIKRVDLRRALERARSHAAAPAALSAPGQAVPPAPLPAAVATPAAAEPASDGARALRILLVDDSDDNRTLVLAHLRKASHRIETAENGEIAYRKFIAGEFDLVLMDMQMPVMDGYTSTRKIRAWEEANRRPRTRVVALTAFALKEESQKSYDAGCDLHLTKPIKKAVLLECVAETERKLAGAERKAS